MRMLFALSVPELSKVVLSLYTWTSTTFPFSQTLRALSPMCFEFQGAEKMRWSSLCSSQNWITALAPHASVMCDSSKSSSGLKIPVRFVLMAQFNTVVLHPFRWIVCPLTFFKYF